MHLFRDLLHPHRRHIDDPEFAFLVLQYLRPGLPRLPTAVPVTRRKLRVGQRQIYQGRREPVCGFENVHACHLPEGNSPLPHGFVPVRSQVNYAGVGKDPPHV